VASLACDLLRGTIRPSRSFGSPSRHDSRRHSILFLNNHLLPISENKRGLPAGDPLFLLFWSTKQNV
jgi:hypothetical protein